MKLIFISGPSGSGKTTLSNNILVKYKNGFVLNTDNYYKTGIISNFLSLLIDGYFDKRISFNSKLIRKDFSLIIKNRSANYKYFYSYKNKTKKKIFIKTKKINFLIIEGIFAEDLSCTTYKHDCFFIDLQKSKNYCMNKAVTRDVKERGKSKKIAEKDFLKSWDIYYKRRKNKKIKIDLKEFILTENSDIDKILNDIF